MLSKFNSQNIIHPFKNVLKSVLLILNQVLSFVAKGKVRAGRAL